MNTFIRGVGCDCDCEECECEGSGKATRQADVILDGVHVGTLCVNNGRVDYDDEINGKSYNLLSVGESGSVLNAIPKLEE